MRSELERVAVKDSGIADQVWQHHVHAVAEKAGGDNNQCQCQDAGPTAGSASYSAPLRLAAAP
jgi:hypothetical protein